MSEAFEVLWDWPALVTFYRLAPHTATIVDRAVIRFVEWGEGHVEQRPPYVRLRAGFHDVVLIVDRNDGLVTVLRVYRAR